MDFLVEFEVEVPAGTAGEPRSRYSRAGRGRRRDEARGGGPPPAGLEAPSCRPARRAVLGLYRAESETELDALLRALPLYAWMTVTVTGLERHPNDPGGQS